MANINPEKMLADLALPGEWQPNAPAALARMQLRMEQERRIRRWQSWQTWAAVAAALVMGIALLPAGRAWAQQVWQLLTVRKVAFLRVNSWPEGVPSPKVNLIGEAPLPLPAFDRAGARDRVHYEPRLPHAGVLSTRPRLYTTTALAAGFVVHTADLESALAKAGIVGETVPREWDGARLALHTSAVVVAQYSDDLVLAQSLPLTLSLPANFDFTKFSTLILRILGVGPEEAQRLAARAGTVPPWLAPIGREVASGAGIEEVELTSGPGTLMQEQDGRLTLVWTVPDRVYVLRGKIDRNLAIATANAVD